MKAHGPDDLDPGGKPASGISQSPTRRTGGGERPDGVVLNIYEGLDELPFYNEDLDTDTPPAAVVALRAAAAAADSALVVTPEYNGTIPAVLKNAIDGSPGPGAPAISRTSRSP